jgi:DNA-binding MarR family transcriptional regulator
VHETADPEVCILVKLLDDIGFLLSRGSGLAVRATNARLSELGLRVRHYSVLSVACEGGGISQRELSQVLGLDPSQIVALVDDLQDQGLVERQPDPQDRRAKLIEATKQGKVVQRRARREAARARDEYLAGLTDQEQELLLGLLHKVAFPAEAGEPEEAAS